ncbi:MAG: UDP-N-acetylmuramate dehydrogenase [Candidatus Pacebacteria bacterium]|nr:UDP-N-acetylmuramate dehydrogenase [Candidatus Paceibacterota bacterium]
MAIQILENVALAPMTTMRVGGDARFFARVGGIEELSEAVLWAQRKGLPIFILGGGANTLVSQDGFVGLVIKIEMKGISYDGNRVTVEAGEWWDDVVCDIVAHDLWGVENLSLIPGTVGGAVVQNIGAYGAEICNTIFSVEALDIEKMQIKTFLQAKCEFGYRESIFKKNKNLVVLRVTLELKNDGVPNTEYEDVKKYFENKNIEAPSLQEIREAIVAIRTAKMPAPPLGTAGSFFKNPVVDMTTYETLKKEFPEIKAYMQGDNTVKLSAAWLIDHVGGWRGYRKGDAGVHEKQALILVNYGNASAEEMLSLAHEIKNNIKEKTNVTLEEEVVML